LRRSRSPLTGPAIASADLIDTTVSSALAQPRVCADQPASGAGVAQRTVTATANGLVRQTPVPSLREAAGRADLWSGGERR
jgi:hypothetical protein